MPPSGGGRRALFSPADRLLARAALRPGVPLRALRCPRAAWGVPVRPGAAPVCPAMPPCAPAMPPCAPAMPPCAPAMPRALWGVPCALCGVPARPVVSPRALWCPARPALPPPVRPGMPPVRSGMPPCALRCPRALWGAPCPLWGCPVCSSVFSVRPCVALLVSVSLAAHHAPQYRARLSPPRGGPLPRPAAALSPAPRQPSPPPRRTAEKKPGRSKRSGRALFISLSGDEAQVSDQALGLPNWQSLLPESEVHISSMFRGSL